ncbi:hypothetical protein JS539_09070 [Bifidobacterium simiarum]|nr:hypothetical protein [Bifidobacterium simiarum]
MAQLEALETQAEQIAQMGRHDGADGNGLLATSDIPTVSVAPDPMVDTMPVADPLGGNPPGGNPPETEPKAGETPNGPAPEVSGGDVSGGDIGDISGGKASGGSVEQTTDAPRAVINNDLNNNESTERGGSR